MTHTMQADGTTHGITAATGVIMTLGTIPDIGDATIGTDITTTHIITDGMADGTHTSTVMVTFTTNQEDRLTITSHSKVRGIRPVRTEYLLAEALHSEAVPASETQQDAPHLQWLVLQRLEEESAAAHLRAGMLQAERLPPGLQEAQQRAKPQLK